MRSIALHAPHPKPSLVSFFQVYDPLAGHSKGRAVQAVPSSLMPAVLVRGGEETALAVALGR
jgi:hypothetical protein